MTSAKSEVDDVEAAVTASIDRLVADRKPHWNANGDDIACVVFADIDAAGLLGIGVEPALGGVGGELVLGIRLVERWAEHFTVAGAVVATGLVAAAAGVDSSVLTTLAFAEPTEPSRQPVGSIRLGPATGTEFARSASQLLVVLPSGAVRTVADGKWVCAPAVARSGRHGLGTAQVSVDVGCLEPLNSHKESKVRESLIAMRALTIGAQAIGASRRLIQEATAHLTERRQFGRPLWDFAGVRGLVERLDLRVAAVSSLLSECYPSSYESVDCTTCLASRRAAELACEVAVDAAIDCVQALGGYGYIDEFPMAALFRDAVTLRAGLAGLP